MFKQLMLGFALMISAIAFSQVGIGTETPQATLDVVGKSTDALSLDGIISPRLTGDELRAKTYTVAQTGALVYVTEADTAPAGQTEEVTTTGYYYFNGAKWIAIEAGNTTNIYNSDGSLTDGRTLNLDGNDLTFQGSERNTYWDLNGRIHQETIDPSSDAVMGFHGGGSNLYIQQWYQSNAAITASDGSTGLSLATHYTTDSAPITFSTSPGGNTEGVERMRITGEGNLGIETGSPTERLDNTGITRLRGLPLNGSDNAHHTLGGDDASATQNQTFTATRTVVADANGVLGYVEGLPSVGTVNGPINIGETISRVYSVPNAVATPNTFILKDYVTANGLPALPVLDGLEMNLRGRDGSVYEPRIYNVSSGNLLVSYQTFATQVNENRTSLNNNLASGGFVAVDSNEIVFWTTTAAEVITTNVQVQVDVTTYRWYEFKWWCMEVSGEKKIFLSVTRKA